MRGIIFYLLLSSATASAADTPYFTQVCTAVRDRVRVNCLSEGFTVYAKEGRLFGWTSFVGQRGDQEFRHVWFVDGKQVGTATFKPSGKYWRGVSHLEVPKDHDATVELQFQGSHGEVLEDFKLKTARRGQEYLARLLSPQTSLPPAINSDVALPPVLTEKPSTAPSPVSTPVVSKTEEAKAPTWVEGFQSSALNISRVEGSFLYEWQSGGYQSELVMPAWAPELRFQNGILVGARLGFTFLRNQNGNIFVDTKVDVHPGYVIYPKMNLRLEMPLGVEYWSGVGAFFSIGGSVAIDLPKNLGILNWVDSAIFTYQTFEVQSVSTNSASFGVRKTFK